MNSIKKHQNKIVLQSSRFRKLIRNLRLKNDEKFNTTKARNNFKFGEKS